MVVQTYLIAFGGVGAVEPIGGAVQLEGVAVFDKEIGGVARTSRCGSNDSAKQQCSKQAHHGEAPMVRRTGARCTSSVMSDILTIAPSAA
jgi:hypothetical protein